MIAGEIIPRASAMVNSGGKDKRGICLTIAGLAVAALVAVACIATPEPLVLPQPPSRLADMVFVPAGIFLMGSEEGEEDETPMRAAYLAGFYIDRCEVTNAEYVEFLNVIGGHVRRCGGHDCADTRDEDPDSHIIYNHEARRYEAEAGYANHPVIKVSWYGAKAYCEHYGQRLPTEAEWEKAARGSDGRIYPWGDEFDARRANVDDQVGDTVPGGSYPAGVSPYGVHDMVGNVWEWVEDWYEAYPGSRGHSPFFGQKYKVVRGGSWNHPPRDARCTSRHIAHPARRIGVVGFRCVRPLE